MNPKGYTEPLHSLYYLHRRNDPAWTAVIKVGGYVGIDSFRSGVNLLVATLYHVNTHKYLGKKFRSIFAYECFCHKGPK